MKMTSPEPRFTGHRAHGPKGRMSRLQALALRLTAIAVIVAGAAGIVVFDQTTKQLSANASADLSAPAGPANSVTLLVRHATTDASGLVAAVIVIALALLFLGLLVLNIRDLTNPALIVFLAMLMGGSTSNVGDLLLLGGTTDWLAIAVDGRIRLVTSFADGAIAVSALGFVFLAISPTAEALSDLLASVGGQIARRTRCVFRLIHSR